MKNNRKVFFIIGILIISMTLILGVTYAVLSYEKTGETKELIVGDIWMKYEEKKQMMFENAIPRKSYDPNNYFEFTISGKNTYEKEDIWYYIMISKGDNHEERLWRIPDTFLRFRLTEVNEGNYETILADSVSYSNIDYSRIWVDKIKKNTTDRIEKKYRLYVWISDELTIGNNGSIYDFDTWNNDVYASIKVDVTGGDYVSKSITTSEELKNFVKLNKSFSTGLEGEMLFSGDDKWVNYNYVWYSGKLWRITAIYPDGSMKMITDENITSIYFGPTATFYTNEDEQSYIYQWLNQDFLSTLNNYENIIEEDTVWNVTKVNSCQTGSLKALSDEGAEKIYAPVGLLNHHEYSTVKYYLINSNDWWLLNETEEVWGLICSVMPNGYIANDLTNSYSRGVRPVVVLKSTTTFSYGDGSKNNPFRIEGDLESASYQTLLNTRTSGEYVNFDNQLFRIVGIENNTTKLNKVSFVETNPNEYDKYYGKRFSGVDTDQLWSEVSDTDETYWKGYLNNYWYNSFNNKYKNMMVNGTFYLGGVADGETYKKTVCVNADTNTLISDCIASGNGENSNLVQDVWTGLVGLPRYGEMFASRYKDAPSAKEMYLLTPYESKYVRYIDAYGSSRVSKPNFSATNVRPSIYLDSNVKILSGFGTKISPYEIGL